MGSSLAGLGHMQASVQGHVGSVQPLVVDSASTSATMSFVPLVMRWRAYADQTRLMGE